MSSETEDRGRDLLDWVWYDRVSWLIWSVVFAGVAAASVLYTGNPADGGFSASIAVILLGGYAYAELRYGGES